MSQQPEQHVASQDLEQHVASNYNRLLSPFAGDLTDEERRQQMEKYGRVIFAPCGCICLEEFAREQQREDRVTSLLDSLSKAKTEIHVYKNRFITLTEENISLKREINLLVAKNKDLESVLNSKPADSLEVVNTNLRKEIDMLKVEVEVLKTMVDKEKYPIA